MSLPTALDRGVLTADCARCAALCCVALPLTKGADFAIDKPAGRACRHLGSDDRCTIHDRLRNSGFRGCAAYDCFGAGQRLVQLTGTGSRARNETAFTAFGVMRALHELLWYLTDAMERPDPALASAAGLAADLRAAYARLDALTRRDASSVGEVDVEAERAPVGDLLDRVSTVVRTATRPTGRRELRRADLAGRDLRGADLTAASLRGATLIAADLSGARLDHADLLGTDLRDANLSGADLGTALFLTRMQLGAARGDRSTRLPGWADRPAHWT